MEYFRSQDPQIRIPSYCSHISMKMKEPLHMTSLKNISTMSNLMHEKGQHPLFSASKFVQPPPFIIGGFVGSKICEQKVVSFNPTDILSRIIEVVTSLEPMVNSGSMFQQNYWKKVDNTKTFAQAVASQNTTFCPASLFCKTVSGSSPSMEISQASAMVPTCADVGLEDLNTTPKTKMDVVNDNKTPPSACDLTYSNQVVLRTPSASESSDDSWASLDVAERSVKKCSNPWLNSIIGSVCDDESIDDSSDDDDSSDWDCVDNDFESENGEIVCEFKWNGDSDLLSPIPSPDSGTPPAPTPALEDYDSDESDGILILCDSNYEFDSEEEARERQLIERRLEDANRRWQESLTESNDVPDGKQKKRSYKKVHFATGKKLVKIHRMLTWNFAYRNARKGEWERLARDTARFRERIETTEAILAPILDTFHREKILLRIRENLPSFCDSS